LTCRQRPDTLIAVDTDKRAAMKRRLWIRPVLVIIFSLALAWAQFRESGSPLLYAHLELTVEPLMPARVYLFKNGQPFRLSPVQALLPLRADLFYRERLWRSGAPAQTLEVTSNGQSHFFLLNGRGEYDLPAAHYRVEAYRGLFYTPAAEEFDLHAGETRRVSLKLTSWAGEQAREWLSGDDHIHLTRGPQDDDIYMRWLQAEDLSVANFLQLQRQMDAGVQYAFGPLGEAKRRGYSIRPGQESRCEFYGHINLLGGRELLRPVSVGTMYANGPEAYPFPAVWFRRGRDVGATVGFAHFDGSMPHSTLLMDLALGNLDFVEVFQFGILKTEAWYKLLNAGFRVTGIAGSDFPGGPLARLSPWPRWIPLLGPERTLVKARPGNSAYEAWAAGVRSGKVVVSNGPLVEISVDPAGSTATASAQFFRPLEKLDIVRNGEVVASVKGDGRQTALTLSARLEGADSSWVAAHVTVRHEENEPEIQAHTNPEYILRGGRPVMVRSAREALVKKWEAELAHYQNADLRFATDAQKGEFFSAAAKALEELKRPLSNLH
jgi:hypothetical protein